MEDINVSTDIALCRKCGVMGSFASLCNTPNATAILRQPPPKGIKIEHDMMRGNSVTLSYRRIPIGLLFMIPFTAFWSGFSMSGIYGTQISKGEFDLGNSLFGIPFLIGTIVLVSSILFMLFGKWTIHLDCGEGTVFVGIGVVGWKRKFTYNRHSVLAIKKGNLSSGEDGPPKKNITITTGNTEFSFGDILRDDVKNYIAAFLMRELRR